MKTWLTTNSERKKFYFLKSKFMMSIIVSVMPIVYDVAEEFAHLINMYWLRNLVK